MAHARDRMLNNMGTFYKRAVRLSIGHGRNWKNAYVGQHRRYRRREIMYFRNIAAFSLLLFLSHFSFVQKRV